MTRLLDQMTLVLGCLGSERINLDSDSKPAHKIQSEFFGSVISDCQLAVNGRGSVQAEWRHPPHETLPYVNNTAIIKLILPLLCKVPSTPQVYKTELPSLALVCSVN